MRNEAEKQYDDFAHILDNNPHLQLNRIVDQEAIDDTKKLLRKKAKRTKFNCSYDILKPDTDTQTATFFIPEWYKRKKLGIFYVDKSDDKKVKLAKIPYKEEETDQDGDSRFLHFDIETSGQYILVVYRRFFLLFWLLGLAALIGVLLPLINSIIGFVPTIVPPKDTDPPLKPFVFTYDENGVPLVTESKIKIFDTILNNMDAAGKPVVLKDKIAPGIRGVYRFEINNSVNHYDLIYELSFSNQNQYDIPLVFKLKKNNQYLIGNETTYAGFEALNTLQPHMLNMGAKDLYQIEWRWMHTEGDTAIGITDDASYMFQINVVGTENETTP